MVVRAYWPGATAQQIADQVTDKLEKTLQEVPYADKIRSYSKPGETLIVFQVQDSSPPKEMPQIWYTARKKIGDVRGTLPAGVVGPFFNDEFGDVYGSIYSLSADGFSYEELRQQADRVRQQLLKVKHVNKVEIFGAQDEKVFIEISQKRLAQLAWTSTPSSPSSVSRTPSSRPASSSRLPISFRCAWPVSSTPSTSSRRSPSAPAATACASATSRPSSGPMSIPRRSRCATVARTSSRSASRWPRAATSSSWASR
jgi:hypothetical protein